MLPGASFSSPSAGIRQPLGNAELDPFESENLDFGFEYQHRGRGLRRRRGVPQAGDGIHRSPASHRRTLADLAVVRHYASRCCPDRSEKRHDLPADPAPAVGDPGSLAGSRLLRQVDAPGVR